MVQNKKLLANYKNGFTADIEGIVSMLTDQFNEPSLCFRELVQNSLDENASKIELQFDYDETKEISAISFTDNGVGMGYEKLKTYLTILDSPKEELKDKIGKFGIGKLSIFAIKPELFVIETGNENEGYKVIINKNLSGKLMKIKPRKGTNVTILKNIGPYEFEDLRKKIIDYLKDSCEYSPVKIIVDSKTEIGKGIDINARYKMGFKFKTKKGYTVKGINAVVDDFSSNFLVLKGGIKIGKVEYPFPSNSGNWKIYGLETIVDSFGFNHPISRNEVKKDNTFWEITDKILDDPLRKFSLFCSSIFKENMFDDNLRTFLLDYMSVISNNPKKWANAPKELLEAKLFATVDDDRVSFNDINKVYEKTRVIYISRSSRNLEEANYFGKKRIPIIMEDRHSYSYYTIFKNKFKTLMPIDENTTIAEYDHKKISKEEKGYIFSLKELFSSEDLRRTDILEKESKTENRNIGTIDDEIDNELDKFFERKINLKNIQNIRFVHFYTVDGRPAEWKALDLLNDQLLLNVFSNYTQSMIALSSKNPQLARFYTLCEIVRNRNIFPDVNPNDAEDFIINNAVKYLK